MQGQTSISTITGYCKCCKLLNVLCNIIAMNILSDCKINMILQAVQCPTFNNKVNQMKIMHNKLLLCPFACKLPFTINSVYHTVKFDLPLISSINLLQSRCVIERSVVIINGEEVVTICLPWWAKKPIIKQAPTGHSSSSCRIPLECSWDY